MDIYAQLHLQQMIRFRLKERLADQAFKTGHRVTLDKLAEDTGISRATLSKIAAPRPVNTTTDNLDALCRYFGCALSDLAEYVPDSISRSESSSGNDKIET